MPLKKRLPRHRRPRHPGQRMADVGRLRHPLAMKKRRLEWKDTKQLVNDLLHRLNAALPPRPHLRRHQIRHRNPPLLRLRRHPEVEVGAVGQYRQLRPPLLHGPYQLPVLPVNPREVLQHFHQPHHGQTLRLDNRLDPHCPHSRPRASKKPRLRQAPSQFFHQFRRVQVPGCLPRRDQYFQVCQRFSLQCAARPAVIVRLEVFDAPTH